MILKQITLSNFGVYAGVQSLCLSPKPGKNVVLFGGKNGTGKSTLLEAIRLCFYGQFATRDLQVAESYEKYLLSRIHSDVSAVIQPSAAAIEVEFDYAESGALQSYSVLRSWERRNGNGRVSESFVLKKNGAVVTDLEADHWQDFIRDLIPAGISQLFFFDGEKIQHLAEDETDQLSLGDSIKALLGLDIIERLQADLTIYKTRSLRTHQVEGYAKLNELNNSLENVRLQLATLLVERDKAKHEIDTLRGQISGVEQSVAARGGGFSKNRDRLMSRRSEVKTRIELHEQAIREFAGSVLPFVVAIPLCKQVLAQLEKEENLAITRALTSKLKKLRNEFDKSLLRASFWKGLGVKSPKRMVSGTMEVLDGLIEDNLGESKVRSVHKLSGPDREQILAWVQEAERIKPIVVRIGQELEQLYRDLQKCERDIARAPSDDVLKPFMDQLGALHLELGRRTSEFASLDERTRQMNNELDDVNRRLSRETDEVAGRAKAVVNLHRASGIQSVLDEYRNRLLRHKVEQLEAAISECFNVLSHKKDTLRTIRIDPVDFSVRLQDRNQRPLAKSELSAGEKQIYAVAVLWGLSKISGRPLPLIVDTPLARLDSDHRRLLAEHYFSHASHQVIILSTDTEIDRQYFDLLRKHVGRSYRLDYAVQGSGTIVREGYFWDEAN
jgi:DNA sulfur modification protein DndD